MLSMSKYPDNQSNLWAHGWNRNGVHYHTHIHALMSLNWWCKSKFVHLPWVRNLFNRCQQLTKVRKKHMWTNFREMYDHSETGAEVTKLACTIEFFVFKALGALTNEERMFNVVYNFWRPLIW